MPEKKESVQAEHARRFTSAIIRFHEERLLKVLEFWKKVWRWLKPARPKE
jgi:hypothetical protein